MRNLFVAVSFVALFCACAVDGDEGSEVQEPADTEVVKQALGEAACATYMPTLTNDAYYRANLSCPSLKISGDNLYGRLLGAACKNAYLHEVANISSASNIRVQLGYGDDLSGMTLSNCLEYAWDGDVYATDTSNVTVHLGSLSGRGTLHSIPTPPYAICRVTPSQMTFSRVSGTRTFVKARVVGQARREVGSGVTYKKVLTNIENAASLCP